jgi:hypothetical protein
VNQILVKESGRGARGGVNM